MLLAPARQRGDDQGAVPPRQETNQISSVRPRGRNTLPSFDSSDKMELVASSHGR